MWNQPLRRNLTELLWEAFVGIDDGAHHLDGVSSSPESQGLLDRNPFSSPGIEKPHVNDVDSHLRNRRR